MPSQVLHGTRLSERWRRLPVHDMPDRLRQQLATHVVALCLKGIAIGLVDGDLGPGVGYTVLGLITDVRYLGRRETWRRRSELTLKTG